MNQMTRTLAFVIAAAASVLGAALTHMMTRPAEVTKAQRTGQPFYPDFKDPTEAASIRIAAWNPNSSKVETFEVVNEEGVWRIPSHYDYPADGEQQLAKAAASAIGITRGAIASESDETHERMGVVDPMDSGAIQGQGVTGTRITLKDAQGETLADFIIGKEQVQGGTGDEDSPSDGGKQQKEGTFYVRSPDEDEVYIAEVAIDVSTKFADWIEKDLLDITTSQLREMTVNKYSINEASGEIEEGDVSRLTRESSTDKWQLADLKESEGTLKASVVNAMARALDDLKIVGVRRKPKGLSASLKQEEGAALDIAAQLDLRQRGFFFTPRGELLSNEGEVIAGTADGVVYILRFGEVFTGSDLEIETGMTKESDVSDAEESEPKPDEEGSEDAPESEDEGTKAKSKSSRYVFVTASLDQDLLGAPPVMPTKPEPPSKDGENAADDKPTDAEEDKSGDTEQEKKPDDACDDAASSDQPADADAEAKPVVTEPDPQAEYEAALKKHEEDLEVYQIKLEDYENRVKDAKTRVKQLNDRFADWYYVIPAETFDGLSVTRQDLIDPPEKPAEEATQSTSENSSSDETNSKPQPEKGSPEAKSDETAKEDAAPDTDDKSPPDETPSEAKESTLESESDRGEGKESAGEQE